MDPRGRNPRIPLLEKAFADGKALMIAAAERGEVTMTVPLWWPSLAPLNANERKHIRLQLQAAHQKALDVVAAREKAARDAAAKPAEPVTVPDKLCPECHTPDHDEDGCCVTCGADIVGVQNPPEASAP